MPNGQSARLKRPFAGVRPVRGRLPAEFVERVCSWSERCVAVAEEMHEAGRFARLVEQLAACSSSVGANIAEADEAMSVKDFRKCLGIVSKELAETRYWLELFVRRGWVSERRLVPLVQELVEIKLIVGAMLNRTRDKARAERERSPGS